MRIIAGALKLLRHRSDRRSLAWAALPAGALLAGLLRPNLAPFLCPLSCLLFLGCGVIAHNHSHCRTFRGRAANEAFGLEDRSRFRRAALDPDAQQLELFLAERHLQDALDGIDQNASFASQPILVIKFQSPIQVLQVLLAVFSHSTTNCQRG